MKLVIFIGLTLTIIAILICIIANMGEENKILRRNFKNMQRRFETENRKANTLMLQYDSLKNALEKSIQNSSNAKH